MVGESDVDLILGSEAHRKTIPINHKNQGAAVVEQMDTSELKLHLNRLRAKAARKGAAGFTGGEAAKVAGVVAARDWISLLIAMDAVTQFSKKLILQIAFSPCANQAQSCWA